MDVGTDKVGVFFIDDHIGSLLCLHWQQVCNAAIMHTRCTDGSCGGNVGSSSSSLSLQLQGMQRAGSYQILMRRGSWTRQV